MPLSLFVVDDIFTPCHAWVLMRNHVHLLPRSERMPIALLMHRLMTSYAMGGIEDAAQVFWGYRWLAVLVGFNREVRAIERLQSFVNLIRIDPDPFQKSVSDLQEVPQLTSADFIKFLKSLSPITRLFSLPGDTGCLRIQVFGRNQTSKDQQGSACVSKNQAQPFQFQRCEVPGSPQNVQLILIGRVGISAKDPFASYDIRRQKRISLRKNHKVNAPDSEQIFDLRGHFHFFSDRHGSAFRRRFNTCVHIGKGAFVNLPEAAEKLPDFTSPAAKCIDEINMVTIAYFEQLLFQ